MNNPPTEEQTRLVQLRRDIQLGLDQLNNGECLSYDDDSLNEFFDDIKAEGRLKQNRRRVDE